MENDNLSVFRYSLVPDDEVSNTAVEHVLKTDPKVFDEVASGAKMFEIRKNDRNYQVGDVLTLRRTKFTGADMAGGEPLVYTGQQVSVRIKHIMHGPCYGLVDGWVIMSIGPLV